MKLLLISNSTNAGEEYLGYPTPNIKEFLGNKCLNCIFIPFAAVTFSYDEYEKKVQKKFNQIGHNIKSIHHFTDKIKGNYSATKYGIFATDCTNLRRFKTTKGGLLAKID